MYKEKRFKKAYATPDLELPKEKGLKVNCPSCDHEAVYDDININDKIAKCSGCNTVYSFSQSIAQVVQDDALISEEISRPEGGEINYFQNEMEISLSQPLSWLH